MNKIMTIEIEGNDCNASNGCYNNPIYDLDYTLDAVPIDQKEYNKVVRQMSRDLYFISCHDVTQAYRSPAKCRRAAIAEIHYQVRSEIVKRLYSNDPTKLNQKRHNINVEYNCALANL